MANKLIFFILVLVYGRNGLDLSAATNAFSCFKNAGYDFVIIRGFRSDGMIDPNLVSNLRNAEHAGIDHIDVYLSPCVHLGNPYGQVDWLVSAIRGETFSNVWIKVEVGQWFPHKTDNQQFILYLVNRLAYHGLRAGIYTSKYNWSQIVGDDWVEMSSKDLWYAHYDNQTSFDDFEEFGGWTRPSVKQYNGNASLCGVSVDLDFY